LAAGVLQLMHPAIAAGVEQHSSFFEDPWARVVRSAPQILGVIYDADPEATGRRVREYHRPITGRDAGGRPYRALQPQVFWWAHATIQNAVEQLIDRFDHHRLTGPERESLYRDGVEWYRRYGVSLRPVPPDHAAFRAEWDRYCAEVLELTPAAARAVDMAMHSPAVALPMLPDWTRPVQQIAVPRLIRLTILGGLPRVVRQRFSIPWRIDEELEYRAVQLSFRESWRLLPPARRYGPTAAAGMRAARARAGAA
jgi:uncharacterized protein (DUF2236 family)